MAPKIIKTPHETLQEKLSSICHEVLDDTDSFLCVDISSVNLKEDIKQGITKIECTISIGKERTKIKGFGSGIVDALYGSIVSRLEEKYCSFEEIKLIDFAVESNFDKTTIKKSKTDAKIEVVLLVQSGENARFVFRSESNSLISACITAVCGVIEYFINSEEAVQRLYSLIQDSQNRNRGDLTDKYLFMLSELVKNVSYENKIKLLSEVHMNCESEK